MSFLQPTSWFSFTDSNSFDQRVEKFVHFETLKVFFFFLFNIFNYKKKNLLKKIAEDLLIFYHEEYQMIDCPEVIEYSELKSNVSHIIRPECFDLVISELVSKGEVSVGKSRFGDKVLKFKDRSDKGPAKFTDVDASVHELRKTMIRLEYEIKKSEEKMFK